MSGLLEKIWLGNVNEQGEVDQEYDEETKGGLTHTIATNKDVSLRADVAGKRREPEPHRSTEEARVWGDYAILR